MATCPIHKFEMSTYFHSTEEVRKMGILKLAEGDNDQVELNDDEIIRIQEQETIQKVNTSIMDGLKKL